MKNVDLTKMVNKPNWLLFVFEIITVIITIAITFGMLYLIQSGGAKSYILNNDGWIFFWGIFLFFFLVGVGLLIAIISNIHQRKIFQLICQKYAQGQSVLITLATILPSRLGLHEIYLIINKKEYSSDIKSVIKQLTAHDFVLGLICITLYDLHTHPQLIIKQRDKLEKIIQGLLVFKQDK